MFKDPFREGWRNNFPSRPPFLLLSAFEQATLLTMAGLLDPPLSVGLAHGARTWNCVASYAVLSEPL